MNDAVIEVGGPAGTGVFSIGELIGKAFSRKGYYVSIYKEYPSLIKGGHNRVKIHVSTIPVMVPSKRVDFSISTVSVKDMESGISNDVSEKSIGVYMAAKLLSMFGFDKEYVLSLVMEKFGKKEEFIEENKNAVEAAFIKKIKKVPIEKPEPTKRFLATGNDAIFLGAVKAGCRHYFAYPMTPTTKLLHLYSSFPELIAKQAEDEIAVINMALGASFAGRRVMVGTSGGGFALMNEALSLAGMAELPIVVVEGQRPGPATGMPTYSSQEDLLYSIFSGHGEFPKVVISPGDVNEAYLFVQEAFNIAENIQSPVVLLTEKNLLEGYQILEMNDLPIIRRIWDGNGGIERYSSEVMPIPGQKGGEYVATSYEHDSTGFTTEEAEEREKQVKRRLRKLDRVEKWKPVRIGNSEFLVIGFGFTKSIAAEAMKHEEFSYLHIPMLWPFPSKDVMERIEDSRKAVVIEANHTGQLSKLISMETGNNIEYLSWMNGRLLYPEEMATMIRRWKNG